jgi:cytochrome c peroxidase
MNSVELEIDRIEAESLDKAPTGTLDRFQRITLLGKIIFYDKQLSVNRNEACSFCHMPETGFAGSVSALNQTSASYPGSVRTRFSVRRPQSHTYASYSPVLRYNQSQGDFAGGQFWDSVPRGFVWTVRSPSRRRGPR